MKNKITYNNKTYKHTGIRSYYISEDGEVLSTLSNKIKIMKQSISHDGYARIELKYELGKAKKYFIHRLVYQTYIGALKEGLVIDHKDGNTYNNHKDNLRQCTQKENIENALNHRFGNNHSKRVEIIDLRSGEIKSFDKVKDLIEFTGISVKNGCLTKIKNHTMFKQNYKIIGA